MSKFLEIVFDLPLDQSFTYLCDEKGEAVPGKRVMADFGKRTMPGYILAAGENAPGFLSAEKIKTVRRVIDKEPIFDNNDIELAKWVAGYYLCGLGEALSAMIPSGRRAAANTALHDTPPDLTGEDPAQYDLLGGSGISGRLELSAGQDDALSGIWGMAESMFRKKTQSAAEAAANMAYLYGITGSGKTEVFLRAAEQIINAGKQVLYLVPEISLTHQTVELIGKRFGAAAAALHSGMTDSERFGEWVRIRNGGVSIVAGPRSAVFAPLNKLGLIIIDEEHDTSYKSGNSPRYHARQVAMHRSSREGALLVLGSATPSAEAWKLMNEGKIKRFSLNKRLSGGSIPNIVPVSLQNTSGCLSNELKEEIRKTKLMGRQTILFLNRRGFGYFYHCRSCGFELSCKRCSVSLTYHKSKNRALCHYCGYETPPPLSCPKCGSLEAGFTGFGTEFIEEEVRNTFPELVIKRADSDTTGKKGSLAGILKSFKNGETDLLLGTQMVAKGLNFPGVRLVGVVLADTGLHLPDFRAAERTFSLIVQVAGRAGRYFPDGKVLVQTYRLFDPAIQSACSLDIEGFYENELNQRLLLNFPPYSRLIRLVIRSSRAEKAGRASKRLALLAQKNLPPDCEILGPAECPISIQNGNYRKQLILRGKKINRLHDAVRTSLKQYEEEKEAGVYIEIDVDPVQLL